jgi:acylphosphatase
MVDPEIVRLHALVEGRVQGVGFRAFVVNQANSLRLTGWVRNRLDDSVEVLAEGEKTVLDRFLTSLKRGPTAAWVREVIVEWGHATGDFSEFSMRSSL